MIFFWKSSCTAYVLLFLWFCETYDMRKINNVFNVFIHSYKLQQTILERSCSTINHHFMGHIPIVIEINLYVYQQFLNLHHYIVFEIIVPLINGASSFYTSLLLSRVGLVYQELQRPAFGINSKTLFNAKILTLCALLSLSTIQKLTP